MNSCTQLKEIKVSFPIPPPGSSEPPCFACRFYLIAPETHARWVREGLASLRSELSRLRRAAHGHRAVKIRAARTAQICSRINAMVKCFLKNAGRAERALAVPSAPNQVL